MSAPRRGIVEAGGIRWLALLHAFGTFVHFLHNGVFLAAYPNLPTTLTAPKVYLTSCVIAGTGLVGFGLLRRGKHTMGFWVLAAFGMSGFGGLLHYSRASFFDHGAIMNGTILFEGLTGALLLVALARATWANPSK